MAPHAFAPPLLHATEQLGDAWWAQHMLPLLLEQKSAAAVTLSSKQLRRLCQSGHQSLRLGDSDWQENAAVAHLSAHFPACKKLLVTTGSSNDLAFHLPDALDTLSGMTSLSSLVVDMFDAAATADPSAMVLALQGVRRLIAGVQAAQAAAPARAAAAASACVGQPCFQLQISLHDPGVMGMWHAHPRVWQAIGQLQGLNSLQLYSRTPGVLMLPSSIAQIPALASLASTLHSLWIQPTLDKGQHSQVIDYNAVGSLSRLTALSLPLAAERQGLSSISSCCQLQRLLLAVNESGAGQRATLQPSEVSALSGLTQLTTLWLYDTDCEDNAGWTFLSSLRRLQQLLVDAGLPHATVAVLARLTCLRELTCGWEQQEGLQQAAGCCAAVCTLGITFGVPPLCAFPGLTSLMHFMPLDPSVFSAAQCCTQLKRLEMWRNFGGSSLCEAGSLHVTAPSAVRTAAVSSLAALQHLEGLSLSVNDNAEVCAVSALWQVKVLYLVVPVYSSCSLQGLAVLAAMRQLHTLTIVLPNSSSSLQDADVHLLLSALRHVQLLQVKVEEAHVEGVRDVLYSAADVLAEQGLQLPAELCVAAITAD